MTGNITSPSDATYKRWNEAGSVCFGARQLDDGTMVALVPFAFTWGLCYDVDDMYYGGRFCFATLGIALRALASYKGGRFEIPEGCIKPKGKLKQVDGHHESWWPDDGNDCKRLQKDNTDVD